MFGSKFTQLVLLVMRFVGQQHDKPGHSTVTILSDRRVNFTNKFNGVGVQFSCKHADNRLVAVAAALTKLLAGGRPGDICDVKWTWVVANRQAGLQFTGGNRNESGKTAQHAEYMLLHRNLQSRWKAEGELTADSSVVV